MASAIHISEAVSIGLHAALCLSVDPGRYWSSREIASRYRVSEAHLAKVMSSLVRAGLITTVRGPHGGARLVRPPSEITLLAVFEAIDGPMTMDACLLRAGEGCGALSCRLGPRLSAYNQSIREFFASVRLADLIGQVPAGTVAQEQLPVCEPICKGLADAVVAKPAVRVRKPR
ncbi:MAG: Rrf2 family transcriptional regulator [bacterium]